MWCILAYVSLDDSICQYVYGPFPDRAAAEKFYDDNASISAGWEICQLIGVE